MIKIRIPATSANLGAGFDALGLALNYYNYVNIEKTTELIYVRLTILTSQQMEQSC